VTLPIELDPVDVAVHVAGSRAWVSLPGRPMLDGDGRVLGDGANKSRYALPMRWSGATIRAAGSRAGPRRTVRRAR